MTKNQVDYANYLESRRHNLASEDNARQTLRETRRHNLAGESHDIKTLEESVRHNKANEQLSYDSLSETVRSNKAKEDLTKHQIDTQYQQVVLQTEASKYAASVSAEATKYAAGTSAAAAKYAADQARAASQYAADNQKAIAELQDARKDKDQQLTAQRDVMNYNLEQDKLRENLLYQYTALGVNSTVDVIGSSLNFASDLVPHARYTVPIQ